MNINGICSLIGGTLVPGNEFSECRISSITLDSACGGEGVIFCAVKGLNLDGVDFILEAHRLGCRTFLCDRKTAVPSDSCLIICNNIRKSIAVIASALNYTPQKRLKIIGVTGTKGKTTVSFLIAKLLNIHGIRTGFIGTIGIVDENGKTLQRTKNTTPDPTVLFPALRGFVERGISTVVLEVSSQAIKDFRVYGIELSAAVFTSLGCDHIGVGEHASFEEYKECKRRLFTSYGAKTVFVNADDSYAEFMSLGAEKCIKCGFSESADYRIRRLADGYIIGGIYTAPELSGDYNAINIALAASVCSELYGISPDILIRSAESLTVPGRFEYRSVRGRHTVIDYAHNAMSFREVISLASRRFGGRIFLVFGSVGGRSVSRRRELAEVAEELADYSIITTDSPGYEDPLSICADIYAAFLDRSRAEIVLDRERAIRRAFYLSRTDDVILLLGMGHEEYIRVGDGEIPFSERKVLDSLMYGALSEI